MKNQTDTARRWRLAQAIEDKAYAVEALGGDATSLRRLAVEMGEAAMREEKQ